MNTNTASIIVFGLALLSSFHLCRAVTAEEWRSRTIYQVFTDRFAVANGTVAKPCDPAKGQYCGGTWQGIIDKLDYIQNLGFSAIWISPITAQVPQNTPDYSSYHGYWQQNLFELNPHFGTVADLQALSDALHTREMYLMVDVVVNHFAWDGPYQQINYTQFDPFNDEKYFHPYCLIEDYTDANDTVIQDCWLGDDAVTLPDLRTEDKDIIDNFTSWIKGLVANFTVDGLRIDSALNVDPAFFSDFVPASGVFATGEVMNGIASVACVYQRTIGSFLNYPVYYPLIQAFESPTGSIGQLADQINGIKTTCDDPTTLASFSENHDVPRFASTTDDMSLAKNVLTYTLLTDGIPIVYQGQEQHLSGNGTPYNREAIWPTDYNTSSPLYTFIQTLNQIRSQAVSSLVNYTTYNNYVVYQDLHVLAMRKGYNGSQVITVLNNFGVYGTTYTLPLTDTGFTAAMQVTELLGCTNITIGPSNNLEVSMGQGLPKVFYPTQLLAGSGMCGTMKNVTTTSGFVSPGAPPSSSSTASAPSKTPLGLAASVAVPKWFHVSLGTLAAALLQFWLPWWGLEIQVVD
ncbi:MAG: hypothetical protein M1821_005648 [Bathelium mastoideum]|nr:MAG: hypothetical protein M1821_005648 [Bathelium mastoideum]KAI9680427.1 MAG: hypothetical protein M1822_007185 [Bathelium mastoideum]